MCSALFNWLRRNLADMIAPESGAPASAKRHPLLSIMLLMARFSRGAAKAGMSTYIRGVRSKSLATAALGAGFARVDGDAVAPLIEHPKRMVEFNLFDLYNTSVSA